MARMSINTTRHSRPAPSASMELSIPRKPLEAERMVTILSVSAAAEDHESLRRVLRPAAAAYCPGLTWIVDSHPTLASVLPALRRVRTPLVLCDSNLESGSWRELLRQLESLPDPPFVIVTSLQADDRLWAEALNLGAYDVLAKPFDRTEVIRVLSVAWLRWEETHKKLPAYPQVCAAAAGD